MDSVISWFEYGQKSDAMDPGKKGGVDDGNSVR